MFWRRRRRFRADSGLLGGMVSFIGVGIMVIGVFAALYWDKWQLKLYKQAQSSVLGMVERDRYHSADDAGGQPMKPWVYDTLVVNDGCVVGEVRWHATQGAFDEVAPREAFVYRGASAVEVFPMGRRRIPLQDLAARCG